MMMMKRRKDIEASPCVMVFGYVVDAYSGCVLEATHTVEEPLSVQM